MFRPKGWHSRGYLPHFDSPEAVQFITFRLADSLPGVIADLRRDDSILQRLDQELDTGLGACWLRQPEIASLIEGALLHFDEDRYRLLAWCIMPNHVHVVIEVLDGPSLSEIVGSWKSFTAKQANAKLGRLWFLLARRLLRPLYAERRPFDPHDRVRRAQSSQSGPGRGRIDMAVELGALAAIVEGRLAQAERGRPARS